MKTVKLEVKEFFSAYNAICHLLSLPGIERKIVYWLDRNRKKIEPEIKEWNSSVLELQEKYFVELPKEPFINPPAYKKFKIELERCFNSIVKKSEEAHLEISEILQPIKETIEKYEMVSPHAGKKAVISEESKIAIQKILEEKGKDFIKEIEYAPIPCTDQVEKAMLQLSGEEQLSIAFMMEEPPKIAIAQFLPKH